MSVLSKALRFAVLVTVLGGCSTGTPAPDRTGSNDGVANGSDEILAGDQSAVEEITTGNSTAAAPAANAASAIDLAALDAKDGSQITLAQEGADRFTIEAGGAMTGYTVTTLETPPRIVVDIKGVTARSNRAINVVESTLVNGIRIGTQKTGTRVVFDLRDQSLLSGAEKAISQDGDRIVVALSGAPLAAKPAETAAVEAVLPEPENTASAVSQTEVMAEAPPVQAESIANAPAPGDDTTRVTSLSLQKSDNTPGTVSIALDRVAPYELRQTAPSEYVLTLAGAEAGEATRLPQIASGGSKGIRSARAVQDGDTVKIRMFVDPEVNLSAKTEGNNIIVKAREGSSSLGADARAQLAAPDAAAAPAKEEAAPASAPPPNPVSSIYGRKTYTGRLISLDLQDTDIDNALRIIAEVSNLNIIASDDVTGKVTLRLIDVPWDQALDVILKTNGLDQVEEGNVIRIAPVEKLRQEREALKEAEDAARALEALTVKYIRVSYARVTDIKEQVESVISERGSVAVDERTNQLIIKDIADGHREAAELIKKLDLRTPQVLLETQIVEGQRTILRDLGFQWNYSYVANPLNGNGTGLVFPNSISLGGGDTDGTSNWAVNFPALNTGSSVTAILDSADGSQALTARLSAFEQERKVSIISRPQVATVNNKQAEIKSVETVRVRLPDSGTAVSTGAGAQASAGGSTAFEEIEVGIDLRVTPQASPDYYVLLDIETKSSTFGGREVDGIPSTVDRTATSTILVKSGQTFALGGVYRLEDQDVVEGVPWLKDIPFLGHAFRRDSTTKSDEELIFFLTPHIVEGSFSESLMQAGS